MTKGILIFIAAIASGAMLFTGCGGSGGSSSGSSKGHGKVNFSVKNDQGISASKAGRKPSLMAVTAGGFTPTSLLFPVKEITLEGDTGESVTIYTCTGTQDDCMVDLADTATMDRFNAELSIPEGTYTKIAFSTCDLGGSDEYDVKIKGTLAGGNVTNTASVIASSGSEEYVSVTLMHCGGKVNYFSTPLTVKAGETYKIALIVPISDFGIVDPTANDASCSTVGNDCVSGSGGTIKLSYPDGVSYVGTQQPTVSKIYVANQGAPEAQSGMQIIAVMDADNNFHGAVFRTLSEGTALTSGCGFANPLWKVTETAADIFTLHSPWPDKVGIKIEGVQANPTGSYTATLTCETHVTGTQTVTLYPQ